MPIKLKRSAVSGKAPATTDLELGELALNTFDGKLYTKKNDGTESIVEIGGGAVTSVAGKTGAVTLVKGDVGLGNVDNTSDANKPVSTATQTALNAKADLASPTFTGTPTAPTPTGGDNSTKLATTAFVTTAIGSGVYRAGGTDVALADGGTGASLADPNADRILFWDDSADSITWLTPGEGLSISGTTLSAGLAANLAVSTALSGASVTFNNSTITRAYKTFLIGFQGASPNNANPRDLQVEISGNNGSTWSAVVAVAGVSTSANTFGGDVVGSNPDVASGTRGISGAGATGAVAYGGSVSVTTGSINAIRLSWSAGSSFDAGTVSLIGIG